MPYIGNTIRAADDYRLIDDISSSFNGSTTSFALQVAGSAPVPFPKSPQQVLISVNGVIQEPDPTGSSGFNLVGTNIVFSSAPTNGHAFFGIIYATADYLNAGGNFPSGSTGAPSLTFIGDEDTGIYRKGSGSIGFVSNSTEIANTDSNGITISSGNLILGDSSGASSDRVVLGASSDLSIYHDGSNSRIAESGTGHLILTSNGNGVLIQDFSSGQNMAKFFNSGAVELYHNYTKRFETTSTGAKVSSGSTLTLEDSSGSVISFDESGTRKAFIGIRSFAAHDGNGIMIQTSETAPIKFAINNVVKAVLDNNGAFKPGADSTNDLGTSSVRWANVYADTLYGDGSNLTGISSDLVNDTSPQLGGDLDTNSHEILLDDNHAVKFGASSDLQIYHNSSLGNSWIANTTGVLNIRSDGFAIRSQTDGASYINITDNAGVDLYHDNSLRFSTKSFGALMQKSGMYDLVIGSTNAQGAKISLDGDSNGDGGGGDFASIEHDTTGNLHIRTDNPAHTCSMVFSTNGTTRHTIEANGHLRPNANNTYDLGTNSYRYRNIYTNDLNLSNEGSSNDVDSTWGDYTIQEGFEDLYLINNRTGKKFKFNLTEVS